MAELGTVYVDIKGDWDGFQKDASGGFGRVAKVAAGAFAAAFAGKAIFDFGKEAVNQASDLNESINAVNQSFAEVDATKIAELGKQAAESYGLSQSAFNAFSVQFSGFAKQIAGEGGDVAGTVDTLTTRIADFASVQNLDVNDAAVKFQSALAGETEAMRKFGIDVSAAAVEQFALANSIGEPGKELTEQEKVLARYGLLMQSTEQWADDFANTSDDLANSQRIAKASFQDVQAELGTALLPVLGQVMNVVRDQLIPAISTLQPVFVLVAESIAQLAPAVLDLVKKLMPLVETLLPPLVDILMLAVDLFITLITPIIDLVMKALGPLIPMVELLAEDLAAALVPALEAVSVLFTALWPLIEILLQLLSPLLQIVGMVAKVLGQVLASVLGMVTNEIKNVVSQLKPLITFLTNLFTTISGALAKVLPAILNWFKDLPGSIGKAVSGAGEWLVRTGKDIIAGLVNGIKSAASSVVSAIKRFVLDRVPSFVKDFFGIASPSKLMAGLGQEITLGLAEGIGSESRAVDRALNSLVSTPSFGLAGVGATSTTGLPGPISMSFNNSPIGADFSVFAQDVMQAAAREQRYVNG